MFRKLFVLACAGGGIYGAIHLFGTAVVRFGGAKQFQIVPELAPVLIPIGLVGAGVGAFLGGILLPPSR